MRSPLKETQLPSTPTPSSALQQILKKNVKRVKLQPYHWTSKVPVEMSLEFEKYIVDTYSEYFKNLVTNYGIDTDTKDAAWAALKWCLMNDNKENSLRKQV